MMKIYSFSSQLITSPMLKTYRTLAVKVVPVLFNILEEPFTLA
jgi:hypothetical protein